MRNFILLGTNADVDITGLTLDTVGSLGADKIGIFSGNAGIGAAGADSIKYDAPMQLFINQSPYGLRNIGVVNPATVSIVAVRKGVKPVAKVVQVAITASPETLVNDNNATITLTFQGLSLDDPRKVIQADSYVAAGVTQVAILKELMTSLRNKIVRQDLPNLCTITDAGLITMLVDADVVVTDSSSLKTASKIITSSVTTARTPGENTLEQIRAAEYEDANKRGNNTTMPQYNSYKAIRSSEFAATDVFDTITIAWRPVHVDGLGGAPTSLVRQEITFAALRAGGTTDANVIIDIQNYFTDVINKSDVAAVTTLTNNATGQAAVVGDI